MKDQVILVDSNTGRPYGVKNLEDIIDSIAQPFASLKRKSAIRVFIEDTIQPLHSSATDGTVSFHNFNFVEGTTHATVLVSGVYSYAFRAKFMKTAAGSDVGSTEAKFVVNNTDIAVGTAEWSQIPTDTTKTETGIGTVRLYEGDTVQFIIADTYDNEARGMSMLLQKIGPVTLDLSGA